MVEGNLYSIEIGKLAACDVDIMPVFLALLRVVSILFEVVGRPGQSDERHTRVFRDIGEFELPRKLAVGFLRHIDGLHIGHVGVVFIIFVARWHGPLIIGLCEVEKSLQSFVLFKVELFPLLLGVGAQVCDETLFVVDGILCDDDRLMRWHGVLRAVSGEIRNSTHTVISIDKVVFRSKLNDSSGINGICTKCQPVEILCLVGGVINLYVLVVVIHFRPIGKAPFSQITHPIMACVEDFLDEKMVDTRFRGGALLGKLIAHTTRERNKQKKNRISNVRNRFHIVLL